MTTGHVTLSGDREQSVHTGVVPVMTHTDTRSLALLGIPADVARGTIAYLAALNAAVDREWESKGYRHSRPSFELDPDATSAGKYIRIVELRPDGRAGSVHSFLVKATGQIVKPAGWQGPAKSTARATKGQLLSRYNVTDADDLARLFAHIDIYGGYLYQ